MSTTDETDYTALQDGDMLAAVRDDAFKWATAFCQHAEKLGHHGIDHGWMIGWFANAIEHSGDVRRWAREAHLAAGEAREVAKTADPMWLGILLDDLDAIRAEGTSDHAGGYGPPYKAPWFIIDTSSAEPEVNWPASLIERVDDSAKVGEALKRAKVALLHRCLSPAPAATVPPAGAPYAYLCESPDFNTEVVHDAEFAQSRANRPDQWTVTPLVRGTPLRALGGPANG